MPSKTADRSAGAMKPTGSGKTGNRGSAGETQDLAPPAAGTGTRNIDLGTIEDLRILDEHGTVDAHLDPKLPDDELLRIHRAMVLTRKLDVRMLNMQRQGQMGTFAPGYGQEATQIGQVYPLTERDWFAPSYRSFGAQLWRGWEIERLLLLWDGFFEGFPPPAGVNDLPFSIVIGSHVLPAVGLAMAMKRRGDDAVALVNFGDGAISQGAVAEAFNFAAVYEAPVVFVCENNGWAISTPVTKQTAAPTFAQRGVGFGIPSIRVDGNDVLAVLDATRRATERARRGDGPTLIETVTFRMSLHTTADDPTVYRDEAQVETWTRRCPITRFETYLRTKGLLDEAGAERVAAECEQEILDARERFRATAKANPHDIFDFMYEELPADLEDQKREYLRKLERKGL